MNTPFRPDRRRLRIVVNPSARSGRGARALAAVRAAVPDGVFVEWVESRSAAHLEELVAGANDDPRADFDAVVVAGGDGTVKHALAALGHQNRVPLGVLPIGSGNDFARDLGIPKAPAAALAVVLGGSVRTIDVARVADGGPRYGCVASVGLDEIALRVVHRSGLPRGKALNLLAALWALFRYRPRRLRITWQGGWFEDEVMFAAITNTRGYAGGFMVSPHARLDDGALDLCIVRRAGRLALLRLFPRIMRGSHAGLAGVTLAQSPWVRLEAVSGVAGGADAGDPAPVALDGELPDRTTPVTLTCEAGTLRIIAPEATAPPPPVP